MKRENLIYSILAVVALILIVVTIGLQNAILESRTTGGQRPSLIRSLRESLGSLILPATLPTATSTPAIVAPTPLPTATPITQPQQQVVVVVTATTPPTVVELPTAVVIPPVEKTNFIRSSTIDQAQTRLINAPNLTISADDQLVLDLVQRNPYTIGFVGRAYFRNARDAVRALNFQLDNNQIVGPSPDAVFSGTYPIARFLYVYTTEEHLRSRPEVAAFIGCYLRDINEEILDVGFFPARQAAFLQTQSLFNTVTGASDALSLPKCALEGYNGTNIDIAGSTTVAPVTQHMVNRMTSRGLTSAVRLDAIGTGAGFTRLCMDGTEDIINADRRITDLELAACRTIGRTPIGFIIGEDAISVIVSQENNFAQTVTLGQLQLLFSEAQFWSEIDPNWPAEQILRATPNQNGGTFATFVNHVFGPEETGTLTNQPVLVATPASTTVAASPTNVPVEDADIVMGYVDRGEGCMIATEIIKRILKDNRGIQVQAIEYSTPETLFDALMQREIDVTACYTVPEDRQILKGEKRRQFGYFTAAVGAYYRETADRKFQVWANVETHREWLDEENRCLLYFFENLQFADRDFSTTVPEGWIRANGSLIESWLDCS